MFQASALRFKSYLIIIRYFLLDKSSVLNHLMIYIVSPKFKYFLISHPHSLITKYIQG